MVDGAKCEKRFANQKVSDVFLFLSLQDIKVQQKLIETHSVCCFLESLVSVNVFKEVSSKILLLIFFSSSKVNPPVIKLCKKQNSSIFSLKVF